MNRKDRRAKEKNAPKQSGASQSNYDDTQRQILLQKAFETATELQRIGKTSEAENLYTEILNNDLTHGGAWHHLGLIIAERGNTDKAIECIEKALSYHPKYHQAWNSLGTLQRKRHRYQEAMESYNTCLSIKPHYADALTNKGNIYWDLRDYRRAEDAYRTALAHEDKEHMTHITHMSLGHALRDQGKYDAARESYTQSQRLNADDPQISMALGNLERQIGHFDAAEEHWRDALRLDPEFIDAHYSIARTKSFTDPEDADLKALQDLDDSAKRIPHTREWLGKLNFSLGKAYQNLKDYDLAFEKLHYANKLIRGTFDYDKNTIRKHFTQIKTLFTQTFLQKYKDKGLEDARPIFVVGMPRSGTTLVEQILASHPDVHGAGELKDFTIALADAQDLTLFHDAQLITETTKDLMTPAFLKQMGEQYLKTLDEIAPDARHVVDKMPTNFAWVGMIKMVFPKAKIIHCMRDPMDTCMSCYTRLFTEVTPWCHDMEELGDFYRQYKMLMAHWHRVLPDEIFDFSYEALIDNQEERTRALLEHCDLPFHENCLNFHETKRAISTASNAQVRKPLYKGAIGQWKVYEKHLKPLQNALKE